MTVVVNGQIAVSGPSDAPTFATYGNKTVRESVPLQLATGSFTPTVATYYAVPVVLYAGDIAGAITFANTSGAAVGPTNWWFALYSSSGVSGTLVQQSSDQLTGAWAASTPKKLALAASVVVAATSVYYAVFYMAGTTAPTLIAAPAQTAAASTDAVRSVVFTGRASAAQSAALAATGTAPANLSGAAASGQTAWCAVTAS